MRTLSKKLISGALTLSTTVWLSGALALVPVAHGQSVSDLQAQINQLLAQIAALQAQLSGSPGGAPSTTFTRDLTVGSRGDDVKALQQWLNSKGYTVAASGSGSPGSETTYFGSLTKTALAKYQAASNISPPAGYFGPKTRAFVNSLAVVGPVGPVAPGTGLAVNLAADNPLGAAVPFGSNNVKFMKLAISGSGRVDTIAFSRVAAGATSDFVSSGVYLLDENGARLTTGRTVNSTTHEVTFTGLNLDVSGTKTLTLVAAMRTNSSGAGNRNAFEIASAAKISASVPVSGRFPVRGNEFTLTSAGVGGVTVSSSTDPTNPKVGERQARVATVKVENTSSTDDLRLKSLTLRYAGAVGRSNLSNFTIKYSGQVVGSGGSISAKDLVVLTFNPAFLLERGQNRIFDVYADIAPGVRAGSNETIIWYVEDANDLVAESVLYGYGAIVTNSYGSGSTAGQHMTIDGGQVTITFNGPTNQDIPTQGQDVTFLDFTVAAASNVEIRNTRFDVTVTGMAGATNEKLSDFKVVDVATGSVIAGPHGSDITASTTVTLSDTWTIGAGQSRRLKVTADIGSASALNNDTVRVSLNSFQSTDIKNVDNNTDVTTSDIVPQSVTGNTMTVKAPDLTVTLSGAPASRTLTAGTANVDLLGINMRATADNITIRTITIRASGASIGATSLIDSMGTVQLIMDGSQIGESKALTGSSLPLSAEFSNLNKVIAKGETKALFVRSLRLSNTASSTTYVVGLNNLANDIVAVDSQGNTLSLSGSVNPTDGSGSVVLTVGTPSMTIARVGAGSTDTDTGHAVANGTRVLSRLQFIATNGDVTVKKIQFGVSTAATNATDSGVSDEVAGMYLKECTTLDCSTKTAAIGGTDGLPLDATGETAGTVRVESATGFFTVPRGESKFFTVEARLNPVVVNSNELADSGTDLYASLRLSNFEAVSGNTTLTTYTTSTGGTSLGIAGTQKVVFKAEPTLSVAKPSGASLGSGTNKVMDVTVGANGGPVSLKAFVINISATAATVSAPSTSNIQVVDITGGSSNSLTIGSVTGAVITGGNNGDIGIALSSPEIIYPGSPKTYQVRVTAADVSTTVGAARLVTSLKRSTASQTDSLATGNASLLGTNGAWSGTHRVWVWSDLSDDSAATETNTQWANETLIRPFPVDSATVTN